MFYNKRKGGEHMKKYILTSAILWVILQYGIVLRMRGFYFGIFVSETLNIILLALYIGALFTLFRKNIPNDATRFNDIAYLVLSSALSIYLFRSIYLRPAIYLTLALVALFVMLTLTKRSKPIKLNVVERRKLFFFRPTSPEAFRKVLKITLILLTLTIPVTLTIQYFNLGVLPSIDDNPIERQRNRPDFVVLNLQTLKKLDNRIYETLSIDERIEVLQLVEYIEAHMERRPPYKITHKSMAIYHYAQHYYYSGIIILNTYHLEKPYAGIMLYTVLHEGRHITQEYLIQSIDWTSPFAQTSKSLEHARKIKENIENYYSYDLFNDDIIRYRSQYVEVDADNFAKETIVYYQQYIENLFEDTDTEPTTGDKP
jgi:hypothetical protein